MAKPYTFPTLYDEALQIHISKLKEWGYLQPSHIKSGTLTWSVRGQKRGSISILVNTYNEHHFMVLDYKFNDEDRKYKISLAQVPSNLGKGSMWFFLCPQTGKLCRKLYSIGGYFFHREAFKGCMYESQTQSKHYRSLKKIYGTYLQADNVYEQLFSKNFKSHYAGKPTKKYVKLTKMVGQIEKLSLREIEEMYLK